MKLILEKVKSFLEKIDHYRDQLLFLFIKPYWPRKISPNQITYVRVAIGMVLFALLFVFRIEDKFLIISLFCLGALTDLFDGSVARGLNRVTDFGSMLDPVADRILIIPIAVYSLLENHKWLLLCMLFIETIGALFALFQKSKEVFVGANIFGKTKMVLVSIVFVAILVVWPEEPDVFFISTLWISLIFAILSIFARLIELTSKGLITNKIVNKQIGKIKK